ncbi:MAG: transglycosylase SLT domain-containing protein [Burkholderiaceae bacterium]
MRFKRQLQLISLATSFCLVQGCATLPSDQASLGKVFSEFKASMEHGVSDDETAASGNSPQPDRISPHEAELKRELIALAARYESMQAGAARERSAQSNHVLLATNAALSSSQVGVVTDVKLITRSVELKSDSDPPEGAIWSDRGELLSEPRLDALSEPAISAEAPSALRPEYANLWERMRAGFALPPLDSPLVNKHIQYYSHKPEYLERMFERGSRYLFYIVEEIEKRGMPGELALLPFVESAMNPTAISPAKAAGLWQFIPSTGKAYNLSQNWWVDNRRDPVHSTQAALDYLQRIYELQGNDWFLALASYNWGEGAVGKAMRRNQASGKSADYLSLNMPQETRHYVPKLMALRAIVANPEAFNVRLPPMPNKAYFVEVEAPLHLDLKLAARFAGMSEDEFVSLNPAHNRPVIAARTNDQIKIPADRVESFLAAMKAHDEANNPFSRWRPYTLEQGESIQSLASRLGISAQEIMRANGLRSSKVLPGTRLLAPAPDDKPTAMTVMTSFDGPRILEKVQRPALYHRVGKKETTESIARRYGVTAATLQAWNSLKHEVKQGMRLLVRPASAQTVLTNESGVAKVIASEPLAPKPAPDAAKATNQAKVNTKAKVSVTTPAAKDQTKSSKATTASNASTPAKATAPKPTSTKAEVKNQPQTKPSSSNNNASNTVQSPANKVSKPKPASESKTQPEASPKAAPRVTASYQPPPSYGLL